MAEYITRTLGGYMDIDRLILPPNCKDVNDVSRDILPLIIVGTNVR